MAERQSTEQATKGVSTRTYRPRGFHADVPENYFAMEQEIIICMAGAEADRYYRHNTRLRFRSSDLGDVFDREEAEHHACELVDTFGGESVKACLNRLRQFTSCLVAHDPVWNAIESVANCLLSNRTVSASAAKKLFVAAGKPG